MQSTNTAKQWMITIPSMWENDIQLYIERNCFDFLFRIPGAQWITCNWTLQAEGQIQKNISACVLTWAVKPEFNFHVSLTEFIKLLLWSTAERWASSYLFSECTAVNRSWKFAANCLRKAKVNRTRETSGFSSIGAWWVMASVLFSHLTAFLHMRAHTLSGLVKRGQRS